MTFAHRSVDPSLPPATTRARDKLKPMKRILAAAVLVLAAMPAFAKEVLPFIENDFSKAVALGKSSKQPIFVDAWAPW